MNGYELSRKWFNWAFDNPEKIKPIHTAIFFFAMEHCNRLGGKEKFGFPSQMTMDAIGVKSYNTYGKALTEISEWGFIKFIERSKNQYSANIISITATSKNDKARDKALDKALIRHGSKQSDSTIQSNGQSIDSIVKPITSNQETINQETKKPIVPTPKKTENVFSEEVFNCFKESLKHFPEQLHPKTKSSKNNWLDTIEKLNRLDKVPFDKIIEVVKKTRADDFWKNNFMSIVKLRQKKDDVPYIVIFNEKFKSNGRDYTEVFKESVRRNAGADLKFS
jgi:hypothetical protein